MQQDFINKQFYNLTLFTLIFGVLFYELINDAGFSYIDEICALSLLILFIMNVFRTKEWAFDKQFLIVTGVFLFYLIYSLAIGSNIKKAIIMDFVIQYKPYIGFFCVYALKPKFTQNQKVIIRQLAILLCFTLLCIGIGDLFIKNFIKTMMIHPSRFATAASIFSLLYLYCSEYRKRDVVLFLLLLSIGLFSGRSKLFGFLVLCISLQIYFLRVSSITFNFKNVTLFLLLLVATAVVAKDKIELYFITGGFGDGRGEEDLYARMALYFFSIQVFVLYFPFGSGFASYATFTSGDYYSPIYTKLNMENMYGLTKTSHEFIADSYYPALAQFGVMGVLLFFSFWISLSIKSIKRYNILGCKKEASIALMIIAFFLIECTSDATLTNNRGFFMMMLLGLVFSDMKQRQTTYDTEKSLTKEEHGACIISQ